MVWQLTRVLSEHPVLFTIVLADYLQMGVFLQVSRYMNTVLILKAWTCMLKRPWRFLKMRAEMLAILFLFPGSCMNESPCRAFLGSRFGYPFSVFGVLQIWLHHVFQNQQSRMQWNSWWSSLSKDIYYAIFLIFSLQLIEQWPKPWLFRFYPGIILPSCMRIMIYNQPLSPSTNQYNGN